jgi:chromosome segregation ATPase
MEVESMSESFWESGAAVEAQPQADSQERPAEPGSLAVSADDFSALEERILRAVEMVRHEREVRTAAESRAAQAEERALQNEDRASQAEARVAQAEARVAQGEERANHAESRASEAEARATQAAEHLHQQAPVVERMQSELNAHKAERDHVRQRVERLLQRLDGLEL